MKKLLAVLLILFTAAANAQNSYLRQDGTFVIIPPADISGTTAATTWVPTDQSGAGLSLTNGGSNYSKSNRTCIGNFHLTYPSTSDGTGNSISLPCTLANNGNQAIGSCQATGAGALGFFSLAAGANIATANLVETTSLTQPTNAQLSTLVVECFFVFITN